MRCLGAWPEALSLKRTLPLVGVIRSAAMRRRVVLPAPFGPSSATNSPGRISSETARRATNGPKRFSTRSKEMPRLGVSCTAEADVALVADKGIRSASHEIAQDFLHALAFADVVFFADRSGFAAQDEAEENVLQLVEAAANFLLQIGRN